MLTLASSVPDLQSNAGVVFKEAELNGEVFNKRLAPLGRIMSAAELLIVVSSQWLFLCFNIFIGSYRPSDCCTFDIGHKALNVLYVTHSKSKTKN